MFRTKSHDSKHSTVSTIDSQLSSDHDSSEGSRSTLSHETSQRPPQLTQISPSPDRSEIIVHIDDCQDADWLHQGNPDFILSTFEKFTSRKMLEQNESKDEVVISVEVKKEANRFYSAECAFPH